MAYSAIESSASLNDVCEACGMLLTDATCTHIGADKNKLKRSSGGDGTPRGPNVQHAKRLKRAPRKAPTALRLKAMRASVKIEMLAAIPGLSRAKAASILEACEGSFARIVGASSTQLARIERNGTALGIELGVAVFRALH